MNHLCRTGIALSLCFLAPGCSDSGSDDPGGPSFTGVTTPGTPVMPSAAAPAATPPSAAPSAPAAAPPAAAPTPAVNEQPPAAGGLDTSGAAAPGMVGATPAEPAPATPPAEPSSEPPAAGPASAGCGLTQGKPADAGIANTIVTFPTAYDGSTPMPVVFAFHGANRTNEDQQIRDSQTIGSDLEKNYVMAFVKSTGAAWDLGTDYPRFQAVREQIFSKLCIDTEHVFAFGHSSGAQFIVQMLGDNRARETGFTAVAPVSSSDYGNPNWTPVPTLLIHGGNDQARPGDNDGAKDIAQYAESNQCSGGTTPMAVPSCNSIAGGVAVNAGCVTYNGCAAPTLFCKHNDPNYIDNGNPTNHGWPCFANSQIFQFFESER